MPRYLCLVRLVLLLGVALSLSGCLGGLVSEHPLVDQNKLNNVGDQFVVTEKKSNSFHRYVKNADGSYAIESNINSEKTRISAAIRMFKKTELIQYGIIDVLGSGYHFAWFFSINEQNNISFIHVPNCDPEVLALIKGYGLSGRCDGGATVIQSSLVDSERSDCFLSELLEVSKFQDRISGPAMPPNDADVFGFDASGVPDDQLISCNRLSVSDPSTTVEINKKRRKALVLGNSRYTKVPWLANPQNDARLMADTLAKRGFDVWLGLETDVASMNRAISEFSRQLDRETDVVLFYYSGHAVEVGGKNYLLPIDVSDQSDGVLENSISINEVLASFGNSIATKVVILDACRNTPFYPELDIGLEPIDSVSGVFVAFSTSPGSVSVDGNEDSANSPYTSALARALQNPAETIEETFHSVRASVVVETQGAQVPWENSSLFRSFSFRMNDYGDVGKISEILVDRSTR